MPEGRDFAVGHHRDLVLFGPGVQYELRIDVLSQWNTHEQTQVFHDSQSACLNAVKRARVGYKVRNM